MEVKVFAQFDFVRLAKIDRFLLLKGSNLTPDHNGERRERFGMTGNKFLEFVVGYAQNLCGYNPDTDHLKEDLRCCIYVGCGIMGLVKFISVKFLVQLLQFWGFIPSVFAAAQLTKRSTKLHRVCCRFFLQIVRNIQPEKFCTGNLVVEIYIVPCYYLSPLQHLLKFQ